MITQGIEVREGATRKTEPQRTETAIVVVGVAPINQAADPASTVNRPIIANTASEARAYLGYSEDFERYGLCESMYVMDSLYPTAPVVFINVLDQKVHVKDLAETTVAVTAYRAKLKEKDVCLDSLKVMSGETELIAGEDYAANFDVSGYLTINLFAEGSGSDAVELTISGKQLDPAMITADDIIGMHDSESGTETGLEVVRQVFPATGYVPGVILAPGWSRVPEVGIALAAKCEQLNGVFRCDALLDLDAEQATNIPKAKQLKKECGFNSPHAAVYWPKAQSAVGELTLSAIMAGQAATLDAQNDGVPVQSPSNKLMGIKGLCLPGGKPVYLDLDQASELNEAGICTAVNFNGWRSRGNYTCAYPDAEDPKDQFITMRRMFDWLANRFILRFFEHLDGPVRPALIATIVDSWNQYLTALAAEQKIAGGSIEWVTNGADLDEVIQKGKLLFVQDVGFYPPAQHIINTVTVDLDLVRQNLLGGVAA